MKICTKCKIAKEFNEFGVRKASNDGLSYMCKSCKKLCDKENQIKNKDKIFKNIPNIKDIVDAENWLNAEPQSSIITQQTLSQRFNLKLTYCTESFDKDDLSFSLWCHFSNDAGEIVTYRSIPANIFAISLGDLAGGNIPGKYNIVKNKDALEKIFNTDKTVEHHETKFSIF